MDNKINFSIPDPVIAEATQKLNEVTAALQPYLIALTPAERQSIPKMSDGLDDTAMQAGAESYVNALAYYNAVKQAAKMNIPGAKAIFGVMNSKPGVRKSNAGVLNSTVEPFNLYF